MSAEGGGSVNEWEEKLNTLLSDPGAMAQVMQLAQSLSGQGSADPPPPPPSGAAPDPAALLSGLDPELLRRIIPLLGQLNRPESSDTARLLHALEPFLREERRGKVERAAQLARLIHLAKTFLTTEG